MPSCRCRRRCRRSIIRVAAPAQGRRAAPWPRRPSRRCWPRRWPATTSGCSARPAARRGRSRCRAGGGRAWRGHRVVRWPGPSSLMLALAASGLHGQCFAFVGYLPTDAAQRAARVPALEAAVAARAADPDRHRDALSQCGTGGRVAGSLQPTTRLAIACGLTMRGGWCGRAPCATGAARRRPSPTGTYPRSSSGWPSERRAGPRPTRRRRHRRHVAQRCRAVGQRQRCATSIARRSRAAERQQPGRRASRRAAPAATAGRSTARGRSCRSAGTASPAPGARSAVAPRTARRSPSADQQRAPVPRAHPLLPPSSAATLRLTRRLLGERGPRGGFGLRVPRRRRHESCGS